MRPIYISLQKYTHYTVEQIWRSCRLLFAFYLMRAQSCACTWMANDIHNSQVRRTSLLLCRRWSLASIVNHTPSTVRLLSVQTLSIYSMSWLSCALAHKKTHMRIVRHIAKKKQNHHDNDAQQKTAFQAMSFANAYTLNVDIWNNLHICVPKVHIHTYAYYLKFCSTNASTTTKCTVQKKRWTRLWWLEWSSHFCCTSWVSCHVYILS